MELRIASSYSREAILERALAAHRAGDFDGAARDYETLIARDADDAGVVQLLGMARQAQGRMDEAETLIRRALSLRDDPVFHGNLAVLLHHAGRLEEAESAYRRALALDPAFIDAARNYACLLRDSERLDEALARWDALIAFFPDEGGAHIERAIVLEALGRMREAEEAYLRGLALEPGHHGGRLNLALLALKTGDFAAGWRLYEARHDQTGAACSPPLAPGCVRWHGEPLTGKTLVVYGEQGFGDQIQFVGYAQMVKRAGAARVIVVVAPELVRLFAHVPGLDAVVPMGAGEPVAADYWTWMLNLPGLFGTTPDTISQTAPSGGRQFHLPAPHPGERERKPNAVLEVGVFWAGQPGIGVMGGNSQLIDARRSLPFAAILALLTAPTLKGRLRWTILQRDRRPEDMAAQARDHGWADPFGLPAAQAPRDFLDTAQVIAGLDLVIGVDSALIHLAAGLGRPTWMLDRLDHCWRWVGDREDSDWYPTLRIFRQRRRGDWGDVLARVEGEIAKIRGR
jgi:Flp pilus assembly protein TadD